MKYLLAPFVGVGRVLFFMALALTFPVWFIYFAGLDWLEERGWR